MYIYIRDTDLVTAVPVDGLAPNGAKPSTDTVLTAIDVIQNGRRDPAKFCCNSKVNMMFFISNSFNVSSNFAII